MKIFIVGYMASGKSVVARKLANLLGFRFVDTDQWIEARCCKSISEIFAEDGETVFRQKEKECIEFLIDQENIIIASGGGMPCFNDAIDLMIELGETIYLKAGVSTLISRLWSEKLGRPMISNFKNQEDLTNFVSQHLSERVTYYNKCKHILNIDGKSVELISKEIISLII